MQHTPTFIHCNNMHTWCIHQQVHTLFRTCIHTLFHLHVHIFFSTCAYIVCSICACSESSTKTKICNLCVQDVLSSFPVLYRLMWLWDISINSISIVNLVLSIGLAVDYSAHIGHAFMGARGTRDERVRTALTEMGSDVMHGKQQQFFCAVSCAQRWKFISRFSMYWKQTHASRNRFEDRLFLEASSLARQSACIVHKKRKSLPFVLNHWFYALSCVHNAGSLSEIFYFVGALSTFAAVVVMSGSKSYIFVLFFRQVILRLSHSFFLHEQNAYFSSLFCLAFMQQS